MTNLNDAKFQEQAVAQWQDWRRFLRLSLQLLDIRSTPSSDPNLFEVEESVADREREIKTQLAVIPGDVRAIFEREVEARRQQVYAQMDADRRASGDVRGRPLDADEVERAVLTALLGEAEGLDTGGIGVVPMADGWYDVEADKLRDVPDETRYRLAGSKRLPASRIVAMAALVAFGAVAIWWTRPATTVPASVSSAVLVNEQVVDLWTPRSITLLGEQSITLPVVARSDTASADHAQWARGVFPLTICAPDPVLAGVSSVQVVSVGDAPDRTYAIHDLLPGAADLVIESCSGNGNTRYGSFESSRLPQMHALGEAGQLSDGRTYTLRTLSVAGPGQDTTLPKGRAQVVASIDTPSAVDWSQMNVILRWPDGQELLPSSTEPHMSGVTFRYLVPLFDAPLEVAQVRALNPASGEAVYWQSPLNPPLTRAQVITQALADVQANAERTTSGALRVTLLLTATNGEPLLLTEDDIIVTQNNRRQPLPRLEALRTPLAAGERRKIELVLQVAARQTITLSIGAFAFQLTS